MTDGQIALLVLILFTVYEGSRWLPSRAWLFESSLFRRWRGKATWENLRIRGVGPALLNPLPPPGAHLVTASWPCVPHEQGLCIWNDESGEGIHLPWNELQVRVEDAKLYLQKSCWIRCIHARNAREWMERIKYWQKITQTEREKDFATLAARSLNKKLLLKRAKNIQLLTRDLRVHAMLIAIWTFAVLPFVYWLKGDSLPSYMALGTLVFLMWMQAFQLWWVVRRKPQLKKETSSHYFGTAVFPPTAIRAADWVCASLSEETHPLAAHLAWGRGRDLKQQAGVIWRQVRWPKGRDFPQLPWNGPEVHAIRLCLEKNGISTSELEEAPARDGESTKYCPRCHVTYINTAVNCSDCKNVPLADFA